MEGQSVMEPSEAPAEDEGTLGGREHRLGGQLWVQILVLPL